MMIRRYTKHLIHFGILLVALSLAACASSTSTAVAASPSPKITQHCGTISRFITDAKNKAAEQCFWQSYQTCQGAALIYIDAGVDTSTTHTFTLHQMQSACGVQDASQYFFASGGGKLYPVRDYTCTALKQQSGGLVVEGCGSEGDILVAPLSFVMATP